MDQKLIPRFALGIAGAVVGGIIGFGIFWVLLKQGLYAIVLPGALVGIGFGMASRQRSLPGAILCGVAALGLALFTEWKFFPFKADPGLGYFLSHVHELRPVTLFMIGFSVLAAAWFGFGRETTAPSEVTRP